MSIQKFRLVKAGRLLSHSGYAALIDPIFLVGDREVISGECEDATRTAAVAKIFGGLGIGFQTGLGEGEYDIQAEYVEIPGYGRKLKTLVINLITEAEIKTLYQAETGKVYPGEK